MRLLNDRIPRGHPLGQLTNVSTANQRTSRSACLFLLSARAILHISSPHFDRDGSHSLAGLPLGPSQTGHRITQPGDQAVSAVFSWLTVVNSSRDAMRRTRSFTHAPTGTTQQNRRKEEEELQSYVNVSSIFQMIDISRFHRRSMVMNRRQRFEFKALPDALLATTNTTIH